ncbi:MAG: LysM peptidoglycan-binding domain-containing protein [Candidatus Marinimicrobia bacterium]|nr:LysM peptidoglycan-binding domain-containing protein [Candidatus Neomarinimicrobiota bacterium]MDD5582338.1 LysM peptidoglycan-binding domain-containing protein [Candidatus Neomarinimicrobiota bacterium]
MRKYLVPLLVLGLLIGCSSKEAVEEAKEVESVQQDTVVAVHVEKPAVTEPVVTEPVVTEPEKPIEEPQKAEIKVVPEKVEIEKEPTPVTLADSVVVIYMTRPGDYLTKIALNEYGRASVWRMIWNWNYEKIGNNPDLIYPYQEYDLKKPREIAKPVKFDWYDYRVSEGETLWSIAKKEYGNNYAWVVILRDNFEMLGNDYDILKPGMVLKLRTKLY